MSIPSNPESFHLLLASSSPRRKELLTAAGIPFTVVPSDAHEDTEGDDPDLLARTNAARKAKRARPESPPPPGTLILGADTVVVIGAHILGKPEDAEGARAMLTRLSGAVHEVITGVALLRVPAGEEAPSLLVGSCRTAVDLRPLDPLEIDAYIASDEWRGKAGAYAIQGRASLFVRRIEGDYSNVVGLPLSLVGELLREAGYDPMRRAWVA